MKPSDCRVGDVIRKNGKDFVVQYASDVNVVAHYTVNLSDLSDWEKVDLYVEMAQNGAGAGPPTSADGLP